MQCSGGLESYGRKRRSAATHFPVLADDIKEITVSTTTPMTPSQDDGKFSYICKGGIMFLGLNNPPPL